ncbi:MAG: NAD-dependent epimerase/dehydratase family protein, partial [Caldilineaceae bacterium]
PDEIARVDFVDGDIAELSFVEATLQDSKARHLIHLAALQVPFCRADPPLGARVNVVGTVNIFEAARNAGLDRVVYASSVAVYGACEDYPDELLDESHTPRPRTHYGVYKLANEGTARIYFQDQGLSSIGLRPHTVYGPGRDQGITSDPTKAMLAAAAGAPFVMSFSGRFGMQYARDVAETFVAATVAPYSGAGVFNLRGSVVHMDQVVSAIETAAPASRGTITYQDKALPVPAGQDDTPLRALLGVVPNTPLDEGVAESIETFRRALRLGLLTL